MRDTNWCSHVKQDDSGNLMIYREEILGYKPIKDWMIQCPDCGSARPDEYLAKINGNKMSSDDLLKSRVGKQSFEEMKENKKLK